LISKATLRSEALAKREAVSHAHYLEAAQRIAALFLAQPQWRAARIIAGYAPIRGEIDPMPLLAELARHKKQCALPKKRGDRLAFCAYTPGDELRSGAWGILEPKGDPMEVEPDLILVPLLAFDLTGTRLGYGGGYYDRTLADYQAANHQAIAIGLAFAIQQASALPREPHDVRLDAVLTENACHLL